MANKFQAPAILTRCSLTKDGGLSLGFSTQELSHEDKLIAANYYQKFGWLLFRENEFVEEDIPTDDAEETDKSPSKRLRSVFYVYWKQKKTKATDFQTYYRTEMEKIIETVKERLE